MTISHDIMMIYMTIIHDIMMTYMTIIHDIMKKKIWGWDLGIRFGGG
jgi:hypothetical protein